MVCDSFWFSALEKGACSLVLLVCFSANARKLPTVICIPFLKSGGDGLDSSGVISLKSAGMGCIFDSLSSFVWMPTLSLNQEEKSGSRTNITYFTKLPLGGKLCMLVFMETRLMRKKNGDQKQRKSLTLIYCITVPGKN